MAPRGETRGKVYEFVRACLLNGNPPTIREVQTAMGFRAVQTARQHLEALVLDGRLVKESGRARGYRLPENMTPGPVSLVPILGKVQAGALTEAVQEPMGNIAVCTKSAELLFGLAVRGESMRDAGILPGDIVIVRRGAEVQSGQIVVALVEGEATVKTLRRRGDRVELHPENPDFSPIVPTGDWSILGRVIEVRRFLDGPS